jgi:hypothetical protein
LVCGVWSATGWRRRRDDVLRKVALDAKATPALADVSQEKSKLGLGDLYAEEYRKVAMGVKADDGVEKLQVCVCVCELAAWQGAH